MYRRGDQVVCEVETRLGDRKYVVIRDYDPPRPTTKQTFTVIHYDETLEEYWILIPEDMVGWTISNWHVMYVGINKAHLNKKYWTVQEQFILDRVDSIAEKTKKYKSKITFPEPEKEEKTPPKSEKSIVKVEEVKPEIKVVEETKPEVKIPASVAVARKLLETPEAVSTEKPKKKFVSSAVAAALAAKK
jgi:hypothetical protein